MRVVLGDNSRETRREHSCSGITTLSTAKDDKALGAIEEIGTICPRSVVRHDVKLSPANGNDTKTLT